MYEHTARRPNGYSISDGNRGVIEHDTKMCCHCGAHFDVIKGSGRIRGFCKNCMEMTCGQPACNPCMHIEKRFDLYEKGKLPDLMGHPDTVISKGRIIIP